ncbi:MAG: hypothetical protein ACYC9O_05985 [Candidatus Latescibacterota bacterium]
MKRLIDDLCIRFSEELQCTHEIWEANIAHFNLTARDMRFTGTMEVLEHEVLIALEHTPEAAPFINHLEAHFRNMAETILR